jgi:hypothetical protein
MQRALGCFSRSIWRAGEGATSGAKVSVIVPGPIVELRRRASDPLYLTATQTFHFDDDERFAGERKVVTDAYAYTISDDPEMGSELFAWHWHPDAGREDPHLHVGRGHPTHGGLGKLHIPSGRIAFEEVLLFAIDELGVAPRVSEEEAKTVLTETLYGFRKFRRWH